MSLVQVVSANLTAPGTTKTSTAISTTGKNALAFCAVYKAVNAGVVTPSDSTSQVWRLVGTYSGGASGLTLAVWIANNITGNVANTFTFATTGADTPTFFVAEFSGRDLNVPLDVFLTASDTVSASGPHTTGVINARGGDDLLAFNVSSSLSQTYTATGLWAIPPNGAVTGSGGYDAFAQYINSANNGNNPNTYSVAVADKLDSFIIGLIPPALPYSDEWLDYFDEVPEVYPVFQAYQQWDYPPQLPDVDVNWNDESEDGEVWAWIETQSGTVVPDVVTAASIQYFGEDSELADEALDQQAFVASFQQNDNFAPATIEESWDWFQEIDDDEWQFRDESNVQNPNVAAITSQPGEDLWEDEDPDEFFADDFGNDDADLPQNDVWDHFPTDDDDYFVDDNFLNITNPGPLPITIEDGWDQEHFGTEDADVQWTEDVYENDPNPLLNIEDAWGTSFDDSPDLEDEYWWIENETDYKLIDNNGEINGTDGWDHFPTDDDDYVVIDDYAMVDLATVPSIAPDDPFNQFVTDDDDYFIVDEYVLVTLIIAPSQPPEDPSDWTQAEDDWVVPDDYAMVDVVSSAQVPVADAWDHFLTDEDDYAVIDDFQSVNNTPTVVADGWDHWLTDSDEEHFLNLDADQVSVPQPPAIEDAFDWTQDADDEEWIFRNAEPVIPLQGNVPEDAWNHWLTDDDDYVVLDDYAQANVVSTPAQEIEDAWDWFYEPAEDNEQDFAVTDSALGPNVYIFDPNFEVYMSQRSFTVIWLPTGEGTI